MMKKYLNNSWTNNIHKYTGILWLNAKTHMPTAQTHNHLQYYSTIHCSAERTPLYKVSKEKTKVQVACSNFFQLPVYFWIECTLYSLSGSVIICWETWFALSLLKTSWFLLSSSSWSEHTETQNRRSTFLHYKKQISKLKRTSSHNENSLKL